MKSFPFHRYPPKEQQRLPVRQVEECCGLCTSVLAERTTVWDERPAPVGCARDATAKRWGGWTVGRSTVLHHPPVTGTRMAVTRRRTATGTWFVSFTFRGEPSALPPTGQEVGMAGGRTLVALPTAGDPRTPARFFPRPELARAGAYRTHPVGGDAQQAWPLALTQPVSQARPTLYAPQVGNPVSWNGDERAAWGRRERRRLADTHQRPAVAARSGRQMRAMHQRASRLHKAAWTPVATRPTGTAAWVGQQEVAVDRDLTRDPASTRQDGSRGRHRQPADEARRPPLHRCALRAGARPGPHCRLDRAGVGAPTPARPRSGTTQLAFGRDAPGCTHAESSGMSPVWMCRSWKAGGIDAQRVCDEGDAEEVASLDSRTIGRSLQDTGSPGRDG